MSDELLTPKELGAIYKVSSVTILVWLNEGRIPAEVNSGRVKRFNGYAVELALKREAQKVAKQRGRVFLA